jgi:hypothetical protein
MSAEPVRAKLLCLLQPMQVLMEHAAIEITDTLGIKEQLAAGGRPMWLRVTPALAVSAPRSVYHTLQSRMCICQLAFQRPHAGLQEADGGLPIARNLQEPQVDAMALPPVCPFGWRFRAPAQSWPVNLMS